MHGITPLYLAAQAGHKAACEALVQAGADVLRTCTVPQSGDVFGPADIALVHFNLGTYLYLLAQRRQRLERTAPRARVHKGSSMVQPLMSDDDEAAEHDQDVRAL